MTPHTVSDLVPITKIRCASCKHFKELKNSRYAPSVSIIAICKAHGEFLRAFEWVEFAKNCKEYEAKQ